MPAGGLIEVTWCLRSDVIPRLRRDFVRLLLLLLSREDSYVAAIPFSDYLSSTVARWIIEKSGFLRLESSSALLIKRREKGGGRRGCFSRIHNVRMSRDWSIGWMKSPSREKSFVHDFI